MMLRLALALLTTLVCLVSFAQSRYMAEVKIVVDKSGVQRWKDLLGKTKDRDLRAEADILFDRMNVLFLTLQPEIAIQLKLKEMVLLDKDVYSTDPINKGSALYEVGQFFNKTYTKGDYDAALLFTGTDITEYIHDAYGWAFGGNVCTGLAVGTVEIFTGKMMTILTAHHIGSILGAGIDDACQPSFWSKGNIMNQKIHLDSPNNNKFSYCSGFLMRRTKDKLTKAGNNCLDDVESPVIPDEVCKDVYGDTYSLDRAKYTPGNYSHEFCEKLHCVGTHYRDFIYKSEDTPEGMSCGRRKRCSNKKCVRADDGDYTISDYCPFGDQNLKEWWGYKDMCQESHCKESKWLKYCCDTCKDDLEFGK